jgi:hypothetical protein
MIFEGIFVSKGIFYLVVFFLFCLNPFLTSSGFKLNNQWKNIWILGVFG